jgi:glycerol-3-phosphate dehydrogenase
VRSLHDDGAASAKDISRDFHLELEETEGAKLLSVFGGKITTARALATDVLDRLGVRGLKFTASEPLPGGGVTPGFNAWLEEIGRWMPAPMLTRMSRAYGTRLDRILDGVDSLADMGRHFGADLYEREVRHMMEEEFAKTAEDVLWRRSKLGLRLSEAQQAALAEWIGTETG